MPHHDYFEVPDDRICFVCHSKLAQEPKEGTPDWNGFCSSECMEKQLNIDHKEMEKGNDNDK